MAEDKQLNGVDLTARELVALAQAELVRGATADALLKIKNALLLPSCPPVAAAMAAKLYASLRLFPEAQRHYQHYLNMVPEAILETFELGMTYKDAGEPDQALLIWGRLLERKKDYVPALFYKALVLKELGDGAGARVCLDLLSKLPNVKKHYQDQARRLRQEVDESERKDRQLPGHVVTAAAATFATAAPLRNEGESRLWSTPVVQGTQQPLAPPRENLESRFGSVLFQRESDYGRITVGNDAFSQPGKKVLFINYRDMCHSDFHESEDFLGVVATAFLQPGSRVLNLGLGCGFTAAKILESPNVALLDIVEINPVMVEACEVFAGDNRGVIGDKRVHIHFADGMEWLRTTDRNYEAIAADVEEPTVEHASALFTVEFFKLAKCKLKPGGLFAFWAIYTSQEVVNILAQTMRTVFENVGLKLFSTPREGFGQLVMYGSEHPCVQNDVFGVTEITGLRDLSVPAESEVNTLANKTLNDRFKINEAFLFPDDYRE